MAVICLEGASAVGKTTTSAALAQDFGWAVVPEVNQLFERPANEPPEWYFERQADRWAMAIEYLKGNRTVVLDGDPFQPLWYNWVYDYVGWQDLSFMENLYGKKLAAREIGFPHLYVILSVSERHLRDRRSGDASRKRRGFETHLKFIEPQRRYFEAMEKFSPNRVVFLHAEKFPKTTAAIAAIDLLSVERNTAYSVDLCLSMVRWLRENRP